MRRHIIFRPGGGQSAEERLAEFSARIDAALGLPNAHMRTYCGEGIKHPRQPWRMVILDERVFAQLTPADLAQVIPPEKVNEEGWRDRPSPAVSPVTVRLAQSVKSHPWRWAAATAAAAGSAVASYFLM